MDWQTIRGCGKVKEVYKKIPLNDGKIKTGEFLNDTMVEFAKVSTKLFDTVGDLVFSYKERQLSSIFLPAFHNLGYGAIQEVPTRRGNKTVNTHGWLDYWVQKDDKWVFLIEVKHSWQSLNNGLAKYTIDKIIDSTTQLKSITPKEVASLSTVDTTYKISLIVSPIWRTLPKNKDIIEDHEYPTDLIELEQTAGNILNGDNADISWLGLWSMPDRMQYAFKANNVKSLQSFCGIVFIGSVIND